MKTKRTREYRISSTIRWAQFGAVTCALFAAVGLAHGIHTSDPHGQWWFAILAGTAAAVGVAVIWHMLIGTVIAGVNLPMTLLRVAVACILTGGVIMGSAQSIATAISGSAALSAELAAKVDGYSRALASAYAEATKIAAVLDAASTKAAGLRGQADMEGTGENGNGKGCGPKCVSLKNSANSFQNAASALAEQMTEAKDARTSGEQGIAKLRNAATASDQTAFLEGVQDVGQAIATLNAIDPRAIIASTGAVTVNKNGFDLSKETSDFEGVAARTLEDRQAVEVPAYATLSMGEAVRHQVLGAAMHGWVLAAIIDFLPLLAFLAVFALSREPYMLEEIDREEETAQGRDEARRERVASVLNRPDGTVRPFRQPAE